MNPVKRIVEEDEVIPLPDLVEESPLPPTKTIQVVRESTEISLEPQFEGSVCFHEVKAQ